MTNVCLDRVIVNKICIYDNREAYTYTKDMSSYHIIKCKFNVDESNRMVLHVARTATQVAILGLGPYTNL